MTSFSAIKLIGSKHVQAIVGTITMQEAALVTEADNTTKDIPIMSLTSPSITPPLIMPNQSPFFIQMADDISVHMQCLSAIIGHFGWRKVTAIYEQKNGLSIDYGHLPLFSDSLRRVDSEIENHLALPPLSSLSDPKSTIEEELRKLKSKSNRVFIVVQSSLEIAMLLFEKVKQLNMMQKGYVWIVTDEIASLLDSVDSSALYNMQGVLGFKTSIAESRNSYREFKTKFRRTYGLRYPDEEEYSNPSIFSLRAYDATRTIAQAMVKSGTEISYKKLSENILSSDFEGLSGNMRFKNGKLAEYPTFQIINVVGKSYKETAFWSPEFGFLENLNKDDRVNTSSDNHNSSVKELGPISWPGGLQIVPKGWSLSDEEKLLKIAVPANGAFYQFVRVSYDQNKNGTHVTGFSIEVFETVVKRLPYHLRYELVPFYSSYDDMVQQVYQKVYDGAVGDIGIIANRYQRTEFSQPYVESGLVMIVPAKPDNSKETWMFIKTFTRRMWLLMVVMHMFIGFVVLLIEHEDNSEFKGLGAMLWFSLTVLFFAQREPLRSNWARLVLAPWLFVILIVTASFTASLSSMMTVSRLQPSVLDIETLLKTNAVVGCNRNSFIVKYLNHALNFKQENIREIYPMDDYPEAFESGKIAAAFFHAPHAEVFLAKYCRGYIKTGPSFMLGGLGFVFQKGSRLAYDISEEILKATESGEIRKLKEDMLFSCNCSSSGNINDNPSLGPQPFVGLFFISGGVSAFAFLVIAMRLAERHLEIFSFMQATLIKFWRWAYTFLNRCCLNVAYQLTRTGSITETNNQQERIGDTEQTSMNVEIVVSSHLQR